MEVSVVDVVVCGDIGFELLFWVVVLNWDIIVLVIVLVGILVFGLNGFNSDGDSEWVS